MFDFLSAIEKCESMLSIQQVSELLGLSERTIHRMVQMREIPSVLISGRRLFDPKVLYWWYTKKYPEALKARIGLSNLEKVSSASDTPKTMGSRHTTAPRTCSDSTPPCIFKKVVYPGNRRKIGQKWINKMDTRKAK